VPATSTDANRTVRSGHPELSAASTRDPTERAFNLYASGMIKLSRRGKSLAGDWPEGAPKTGAAVSHFEKSATILTR
jgi:hypothetical protein